MKRACLIYLLVLLWNQGLAQSPFRMALFDNTKNETAGNADWIIDTHQPVPSPPQSGITSSTPETYWVGAISAWGVDLVKRGFTVHTLTRTYGITYGDPNNPYDLSRYNLFVVCEPQNPFTLLEQQAIVSFVANGGGLFMVADHDVSDRDNDGWDSPKVWNSFGADSLFGIHFQSTGESDRNISQRATNLCVQSDNIMNDPAGTVNSLSFYNGTTIRLMPSANATATGHIWMNTSPQGSAKVMAATARYKRGKVAAIGDSSPADDGTGQSGNALYVGWNEPGTTNNILFLNLSLWLASDTVTTDVTTNDVPFPARYDLNQNYPNPFNPSTTIKFNVPEASNVTLRIYDIVGREVTTLVNNYFAAGYHSVSWNAGAMASGVYFYRITVTSVNGQKQSFIEERKLILMK
jgi:hypothetical protein